MKPFLILRNIEFISKIMSLTSTTFVSLLSIISSLAIPTPDLIKGTKPLICGLNEEPTDCLKPCLPTCEVPQAPICTFKICLGGCICKNGYIRESERGKCVPTDSCVTPGNVSMNHTVPQCSKDEVFSECANNCQATCSRTDMSDCVKLMCAHGCVCKEGYIREEQGGECIRVEKCT